MLACEGTRTWQSSARLNHVRAFSPPESSVPSCSLAGTNNNAGGADRLQ
jgi:hypothetical protein